jgi:hypothetical protein
MSNQWNELLDGLLPGITSIAEGLQKKGYLDDADNKFNAYKKKIIDGYNMFTNKRNGLAGGPSNQLTPNVENSSTGTGVGLQIPMNRQPQEEIKPMDLYNHLIDFKTDMIKNPYGKEYTKNATDLFNMMFKEHTPKILNSMNFDDVSTLNRKNLFNNLMNLNGDVRNQVLRNDDFARKVYRKKTGKAWIDSGGGTEIEQ